jgi:hypothetical protein
MSAEKSAFSGDAAALLFTGDRPESCGLTMVKAMTCSITVFAFRPDSVLETVAEGLAGRVAEREAEFLCIPHRLLSLPHPAARRRFEEKCTAARITGDYLGVHHELLRMRQMLARDSVVASYLEPFGDGLIAHVE